MEAGFSEATFRTRYCLNLSSAFRIELCDGPTNMARDLALMSSGSVAWRLYQWDGPWVTLGKFQSPQRALKQGCPVQWVMRPTGGKAVLHGHDLTLGLSAPLDKIGLAGKRSVSLAYRAIIEPLVLGLQAAGLPAELGERTRWVRDRGLVMDCFAHIAPNDVVHVDSGQKLIGCALKMTDRAVLVQASIPIAPPLVDPGLVFDQPAGVSFIRADRVALAAALHENLISAFGDK